MLTTSKTLPIKLKAIDIKNVTKQGLIFEHHHLLKFVYQEFIY